MLFNSIDFAIFLPIVFFLYWFAAGKHIRLQNIIIVAASFVFYGWWDWRFLSLLVISAVVDYCVALKLENTEGPLKRKLLLSVSLIANLGMLGFFKYFNFFVANFVSAFTFLGQPIQANMLNIILPVGISFYTFQTLSYTIDVYKKQLKATDDIVAFLAFISFFPQLVAGPIERASNLLPQFLRERFFDYPKAVDGLRQILWGLFKKIVISDNCAEYVNIIFNGYQEQTGSTLLLGAVLFTFQIYCDFSGYSDIAIGTARLFGFDLMQNFNYPYFSRDVAEFWRRWHISLSTWFKDYVYIPLGGSRGDLGNQIRNIFIVFLLSGFWHGANWTFIVWGALNAIYFLPLLIFGQTKNYNDIVAKGRLLPNFKEIISISSTFMLTVLGWIFFRSQSLSQAFHILGDIFSKSLFTIPSILPITLIVILCLFIVLEWIGREEPYAIAKLGFSFPKPIRWGFYYGLAITIFLFAGKEQDFIYFQF
jgi:D-alanyl-lipoteichoic acid acyltransferase DltB (MBOAT superfamily)